MIIDKFGLAAVRNAWYDPKQVDDHVLQGYTKVQLVIPDLRIARFFSFGLVFDFSGIQPGFTVYCCHLYSLISAASQSERLG